jgi:hypothetical protein
METNHPKVLGTILIFLGEKRVAFDYKYYLGYNIHAFEVQCKIEFSKKTRMSLSPPMA